MQHEHNESDDLASDLDSDADHSHSEEVMSDEEDADEDEEHHKQEDNDFKTMSKVKRAIYEVQDELMDAAENSQIPENILFSASKKLKVAYEANDEYERNIKLEYVKTMAATTSPTVLQHAFNDFITEIHSFDFATDVIRKHYAFRVEALQSLREDTGMNHIKLKSQTKNPLHCFSFDSTSRRHDCVLAEEVSTAKSGMQLNDRRTVEQNISRSSFFPDLFSSIFDLDMIPHPYVIRPVIVLTKLVQWLPQMLTNLTDHVVDLDEPLHEYATRKFNCSCCRPALHPCVFKLLETMPMAIMLFTCQYSREFEKGEFEDVPVELHRICEFACRKASLAMIEASVAFRKACGIKITRQNHLLAGFECFGYNVIVKQYQSCADRCVSRGLHLWAR